MIRFRLWLLLFPLYLFWACTHEEAEVPLSTQLISVRDKFYDVEALSPEQAVVVGYNGRILITTDAGKTWQAKDSGTDLALYSVAFADPQTGWISGQDGLILRTVNGGESWQKQESQTDMAIFALSFIDRNRGWGAADRATYLRTTSGGESWEVGYIEPSLEGVGEDVTLALVDPVLYDVHFIDEKQGWMVGEFGKIFHSADGGVTWQEQQNTLLGQAGIDDALNLPAFFGVHFASAAEGVVVGLEGKIAKTTNGGEQWTFTAQDLALLSTDPLYAPRLLENGTGWIVGAAGRVLKLQDGEWKPVNLGTPIVTWLRAVDFFDANTGWIVGGYGTILHTTDGGKNWLQSLG